MSDWGQLEHPQASDLVSGGYRLTCTHRNGREQKCQWDFIATPEGLAGMLEQKEEYTAWGFSGFEFWVLDENRHAHPYIDDEQVAEVSAEVAIPVEVVAEMPLAPTIVEPQESDTIRVHLVHTSVLGIVWAGNDLSKAKEVFDYWTRTRWVGQASIQFRHTDGSGWSIQYDNPDLYWDRNDEYLKAYNAGMPFSGVRS